MPVASRSWQFADVAENWNLTLAPDSLTIETRCYESRTDLIRRWAPALRALGDAFQPSLVERIGTRFVDRIVGAEFEVFETLFNSQLIGSAIGDLRAHIKFALNQVTFAVEEGELLLRWGVLPPEVSPDPMTIRPLGTNSFAIDIDVWSTERHPFELANLENAFLKLAKRAYSVFRFAVTDQFLKTYGSDK